MAEKQWRWWRGRTVVLVEGSEQDGRVDAVDSHGRLLSGLSTAELTTPSNPLTTLVLTDPQKATWQRACAEVTGPGVRRG